MDLVPYAVPFFLLAILVEYLYGRSRGHDTYRLNDSINSLSLGVLSTSTKLLGLNIGGVVFASASTLAPFALDPASPWTWLAALLLYDFCYYWFHRISHERTLLWASHVAHHQSEEFNLTTALRQTSTGFLLGWVFYIPCFLAGIPASVFVTVASAHLIYQFWIHSRHIPKLGPLEWVLVTASNHRVHHAQNPAYVDRNYGGLLIVWDRLFGTFAEERAEE
ncbi:MAG: sterol desaturase family protein, partial [Gammaproteobacteria bacterium]